VRGGTSGDAVLEPNKNYSNAALTRIHSRVKRVGVQQKLFLFMVLPKEFLNALRGPHRIRITEHVNDIFSE
jgi:hypothetical protein